MLWKELGEQLKITQTQLSKIQNHSVDAKEKTNNVLRYPWAQGYLLDYCMVAHNNVHNIQCHHVHTCFVPWWLILIAYLFCLHPTSYIPYSMCGACAWIIEFMKWIKFVVNHFSLLHWLCYTYTLVIKSVVWGQQRVLLGGSDSSSSENWNGHTSRANGSEIWTMNY